MFCFQCEQTAKGKGCTVSGVCGKKENIADIQDILVSKLISLAVACKKSKNAYTTELIVNGLFITITNVNYDYDFIDVYCKKVDAEREKYENVPEMDMESLWGANEDIRSLKSLILFGLKGIAAYAHHARVLGFTDEIVDDFFYKSLDYIYHNEDINELLEVTLEAGNVNLKCMELLDTANTETYGNPEPTQVTTNIEKGPFIVVSGHDLHDLYLLLQQTDGKGINIYTHGEMLPCHAYPKLKAFKHLKGNFGTAWQSQQREFENIPGPVLFTTNCIMPVRNSYSDRIFTSSIVAYPGMIHIDDNKDFTPVIEKALELGGYPETQRMTGINGGETLTTGFGHNAVLSNAGTIVEAVKAGAIKHFFLVGGCDGANPGRNYYTEFVKQTPSDTVILTLACGKYRFNDLDLGNIGPFPRILDMGQCNDAYSAIKVASALAEVFECGVNDLPLTLVLSWYEQKAVCILLSLLALGIKNMYIGPTLPAFISPNVLNIIVEKWNLTPISTPEEDLAKILAK